MLISTSCKGHEFVEWQMEDLVGLLHEIHPSSAGVASATGFEDGRHDVTTVYLFFGWH